MKYNCIHILLILLITSTVIAQRDLLRSKLELICRSPRATMGVGILDLDSNDTITLNNQNHYPMQSVYKFHLALAVLNQVDRGRWTLDQNIWIAKKDLLPNTWSPLRDKYPTGNLNLPLSEILKFTVSQSDNNGCDILFRLMGGPSSVNTYIHSLGIMDIAIKTTEKEMHKNYSAQFANWTTPLAAVQALQIFYNHRILSESSRDFLWDIMVQTSTGPHKIKGLLPTDVRVGHKTGYSGANTKGITAASNDIGILELPNGRKIALAVFVSQSAEDEATNDRLIAEIAKIVWDHYTTH